MMSAKNKAIIKAIIILIITGIVIFTAPDPLRMVGAIFTAIVVLMIIEAVAEIIIARKRGS